MASLFISKHNKSSLKLGSYDKNAIAEGSALEMLRTRHKGTWAVQLKSFQSVGGNEVAL